MAWRMHDGDIKRHDKVDCDGKYHIDVATNPEYYGKVFSARAKTLLGEGACKGALNAYSMAIVYSFDENFLALMLSNRSLVHLKMNKPYFAYIDACESLRIDPSMVKALFRKGKALSELCFFAKARTCYQDCLAKVQGDKATINSELEKTENKEDVPTIKEIRLDNYDPLESDPREYGREKFCGDLNRYLLNGEKFVDVGDHGRFPYDSVTWKSAIQLYYHFFDKAVEARKKKNYVATIHHLDVAQALDLEPNKHVCNGYNPFSKYGIQVGPNPGLAMLRAESYLQMNKIHLALLGLNYAQLKYEEATRPAINWSRYMTFLITILKYNAFCKAGVYSIVKRNVDDMMNFQIDNMRWEAQMMDGLTGNSKFKQEVQVFPPLLSDLKKRVKNKVHINETTKPALKKAGIESAVVLGSCTKFIQKDTCTDSKIIALSGDEFPSNYQTEISRFNEVFDDDSEFKEIVLKLVDAGRFAWRTIFPTLEALKKAKGDADLLCRLETHPVYTVPFSSLNL